MIESTLLLGTIFSIASGGVYFYVGRSLSRRHVISPDARHAWFLFVVWWYALASTSFLGGILNLLGAIGLASLPLFLTFTQINLLVVCIALYGLMAYLVYLFTGNHKVLTPLTFIYLGYYIFLMYYLNLSEPVSVSIGRWSTTLHYQQAPTGPFITFLLILIVGPQIIGSLAYFSLYFRVKDTTQKYRIAVVSCSIAIWFLSSFIVSLAGLNEYDAWQIISRLIGLSAALAILMAYQPISWIRNHLGVSTIREESN